MSAAMPSRSRPRSWKPNWVAVSQVISFTASSSVKACLSRTQWLSRCVCSEESMICETCAPEVGEGHDRARMLHQLERLGLVLVGDRLDHEELHVALERHVDHQIDRMRVLLPRQLGHRLVRALHVGHGVDPVPIRRPRLGAAHLGAFVGLGRDLDQAAAHVGILQRLLLLGERLGAQLLPQLPLVERQVRLERQQHVQRPAVDLGEHAAALAGGALHDVEGGAPGARRSCAG